MILPRILATESSIPFPGVFESITSIKMSDSSLPQKRSGIFHGLAVQSFPKTWRDQADARDWACYGGRFSSAPRPADRKQCDLPTVFEYITPSTGTTTFTGMMASTSSQRVRMVVFMEWRDVGPASNPACRIFSSLSRCIRIHQVNQNERSITSTQWDVLLGRLAV